MIDDLTSRSRSTSYLLPAYAWVFDKLRKLSIFALLRGLVPAHHYHAFVDIYLVAHVCLAFLSFALFPATSVGVFTKIFLCYGAWRCIDLAVLHLNQLLFDEYRVIRDNLQVPPLNARRIVLTVLHNYVETIFWFSFFYGQFACDFNKPGVLKSTSGAVYFSVVTATTVGYGDVTPVTCRSQWLVVAQIMLSFFLVITVVARSLSLIRGLDRAEKID